MKKMILFLACAAALSTTVSVSAQNLPVISTSNKMFYLEMGDDDTPLIYGYERADINSKKLICFSSFTKDVENNPHQCTYGAFYDTSDLDIRYDSNAGDFVKLRMKTASGDVYFYIEKKNINFN